MLKSILNLVMTPTARRQDLGLLLLRLSVGAVFVFHGSQKLFGAFGGHGIAGFAGYLGQLGVPLPVMNAWLAASAEFFGGLALLLGLATPLAAVPLTITMLVAGFTAHSGFDITQGGNEYTLVLASVALALGLNDPGRYSLQGLFVSAASVTEATPLSRQTELLSA
ncbi:MAG: DoxX family protein [Candidatus Sericytochromatia bacterium]|nr:DoxX family protein [Candidatus Sericytochromatia bacterium]